MTECVLDKLNKIILNSKLVYIDGVAPSCDERNMLIEAVLNIAGAYREETSERGKRDTHLQHAMEWVYVALAIDDKNIPAQMLEARILIDSYTPGVNNDKTPSLGRAISRLQSVIKSEKEPYCSEATQILKPNITDIDMQEPNSVQKRYRNHLHNNRRIK